MADLDKLIVRIEADLNDLKKGLNDAERKVKDSSGKIGNSFKGIDNKLQSLGASTIRFGAILGTTFGVLAIKDIVGVGVEIENLRIRFKALFGDADTGAKAFDELLAFAGKVPFSLQEIQAGAGSLAVVSNNAEQLAKNLEITGNVAAAGGLTFVEAAQQIQRAFGAGVASADLLRDRGVSALAGFQSGVQYTARETIKVFEENFSKGGKFGNLTNELADSVAGTFSMIQDSIFAFKVAISEEFMKEIALQLNLLDGSLKANAEEINKLGTEIGKSLAEITASIVTNLDKIGTAIKIVSSVLVGSAFYKFVTNPQLAVVAGALYVLTEAFSAVPIGVKKATKSTKENAHSLEEILNLLKVLPDPLNKYGRKTEEVSAKQIDFGISLQETIDILERTKEIVDDVGKEISDVFAQTIVRGGDFKEALKDVFRSAAQEIIAFTVHLLFLEKVMKQIKDAIEDLIKDQKEAQKNQLISTAVNAFAGSIPFLANGGNVLPNRPVVVGERGAELFVPKQAGDIIPNNQLSSGGGVTINQTLSFSTGVNQTVRAEIMNLLPVIKQETVNAVAESRSRGGTFARTFGA
jgi:hypothetical protein